MSNLTEKDIELARDAMQLGYRQHGHEGDCEWVNQLCDMAKRTLDEETTRKIAVRRAEKAEHRAQRAEAECERLRVALRSAKSEFERLAVPTDGVRLVDEALATPPPESEHQIRQAEIGNRPKDPTKGEVNASHTPEQARIELVGQVYELVDQIERTLHLFGGDDEGRSQAIGAIEHARRVAAPYNYNGGDTQQAHGDALAALDAAWEGLSGLNANAQKWQQIGTLYRIARQALTASGVPERGDVSLDQYEKVRKERDRLAAAIRSMPGPYVTDEVRRMPERMRGQRDHVGGSLRKMLDYWIGETERALASAPSDSGLPYVPENIRNLPEKLDRDEQSLWRQGGKRERQMAEGMRRTIKQLRKALASAPAVPKFPAGWKVNRAEQNRITIQHPKIGFAVLTNESDDNPRVTIAYELIDAMIAAAPTDGRE